ncbi:hypothetical protein [Dyadobacter koreensis]|uniref:hypothetical protein n=1 Tax=Dyadobacter koreensis TaxID=408657 RepID=UPI0015A6E94A|nr:hypothetical protein [Dyadobacter koreensis]
MYNSTFWQAVLYDQALTDKISKLISGVNPSESGYVFGFELDNILYLLFGFVHRR